METNEKIWQAARLILRVVAVLLYNQLTGEPAGPTRDSQFELLDEARRFTFQNK